MFYNNHPAAGSGNTLPRSSLEDVLGVSLSYERFIHWEYYFRKPACHFAAWFFSFPWPSYVYVKPAKWSPQLLGFDTFILYLYLFIQFPSSWNNKHYCYHKQASHSATMHKQSSPTFLVTFSRLSKKAKASTKVIKQWILYPDFFLLESSSQLPVDIPSASRL